MLIAASPIAGMLVWLPLWWFVREPRCLQQPVLERRDGGLRARIGAMPDRAALHEYDR